MEKTHGQIEDCLSLDSRTMARYKVFNGGGGGSWVWRKGDSQEVFSSITYHYDNGGLVLSYTCNEQQHRYLVNVVTTPCNYGGKRYWFNCPKCFKRVAKLYLRNSMFFCRTCHQLNYISQQWNKSDIPLLRVRRLRSRLQWSQDVRDWPIYQKPKNMRYKKFSALVRELEKREQERLQMFIVYLNGLGIR